MKISSKQREVRLGQKSLESFEYEVVFHWGA